MLEIYVYFLKKWGQNEYSFYLFHFNQIVFFSKSLQIAFLNFKGRFLKICNFSLHISVSWRSHIFRANHARELCDIPF